MKIEFTRPELEALFLAASEVMDHGDVFAQTFPHASTRAAAERAYEKVQAAMKKRRRPSGRDR
jgi:hypothetical protein